MTRAAETSVGDISCAAYKGLKMAV